MSEDRSENIQEIDVPPFIDSSLAEVLPAQDHLSSIASVSELSALSAAALSLNAEIDSLDESVTDSARAPGQKITRPLADPLDELPFAPPGQVTPPPLSIGAGTPSLIALSELPSSPELTLEPSFATLPTALSKTTRPLVVSANVAGPALSPAPEQEAALPAPLAASESPALDLPASAATRVTRPLPEENHAITRAITAPLLPPISQETPTLIRSPAPALPAQAFQPGNVFIAAIPTSPDLPPVKSPAPFASTVSTFPLYQSPGRTRWPLRPYRHASPMRVAFALPLRKRKHIARLQYFSRKHLRRARVDEQRDRRRLWSIIWSTTVSFVLLAAVLFGLVGYVGYQFVDTTQGTYASQVLTLRDLLPPDNLKIYDSQGNLIDQLTDNGIHTEVKYAEITPDLVDATVAIEDHSFWSNPGVDVLGLIRSAISDLHANQPVEGGSTITQQLIKLLIVRNSSDIIRKLSEIVLAPQVNGHYTKRDIMEMYLNTIYYGEQAYGIDAAANVYFDLQDKPGASAASQLDLAQSALLAGLPRNAALYDPFANFQVATTRFQDVLNAMVDQGYITRIQAEDAAQEELSPTFFKVSPTLQDQAPHFDNYILDQLQQLYHLQRSELSRSGLKVYTTINLGLQNKILKIMQQHIAEIRQQHNVTNAAEVLIDFHTGSIISMLGSIDYYDKSIDGQYNAALGYRQPGSSFKPYVYVTAFEQGASPGQAVDDAKTTFNNPGGTPATYTPSNYDLNVHGHMTLRCALQNSLNIPAVRVLQHVGVTNALQTAQAMGIQYEGTPGLSMVLGGLDVRLLDHTSAIGTFADSGVHVPYYSISKIVQGTTGNVLYQHTQAQGTRVITPQLAYMMTNVLSDNTSRLPEFFDCNVLQLYVNSQQDCWAGNRGAVRPAAAKTGTTQDFRDNWTVGYTTDYVMGVWAGNDNNSPMINVTGVQGAAPIWHDAMLLAERGRPIRNFQNPGGLVQATVTYPDGVTSTDLYLPGDVPHFSPTPMSTPTPGSSTPTPAPYCSTFSFASPPPAGSGIPANGQWW